MSKGLRVTSGFQVLIGGVGVFGGLLCSYPRVEGTVRPGSFRYRAASQQAMIDAFERLKTALADRYTIERELGAGGMATVYLAK